MIDLGAANAEQPRRSVDTSGRFGSEAY